MQRAEFWGFQIRKFAKSDQINPPQGGAVVFVGSSSIRYWRTLERDLAPLPIVNRGFGGAHIAHVNHYAKTIIVPYRPNAVVVYAGENDLCWPSLKTPEAVLQDFERFIETVKSSLPATRIYFISIKLSPPRHNRRLAIKTANRLIEGFARSREGVTFIDVSTAMLDANGNPRRELFRWDRMHLSEQGYELWRTIVKPILEQDLMPACNPH